jgi:hypothetical protein
MSFRSAYLEIKIVLPIKLRGSDRVRWFAGRRDLRRRVRERPNPKSNQKTASREENQIN